jgi:hypothetical protein
MLETVLCVALPQEVMARPYVAAKMAEFEGHALPPDHQMDRDRLLALLDNRQIISPASPGVAAGHQSN